MGRNATLDYARLVAAFGIVFFHAGAPGGSIGYAALPFFLLLLIIMAVPAAEKLPLRDYMRGRARRLLVPWVVWSAVFGALELIEIQMTAVPASSEFSPYMLLTGPALHLWFLPFAFCACILIYPAMRLRGYVRNWLVPILSVGVGVAALVVLEAKPLVTPVVQWVHALPAVCLGLGFAVMKDRQIYQWLLLATFIFIALMLGATSSLVHILVAAVALIFCLNWALPASRWSHLASSAAMGVYLSHPIVFSLLRRATDIPQSSLLGASVGCLGALGIALFVDRATIYFADRRKMPRPTKV